MKTHIIDNTNYLSLQQKRVLKNQVKLILKSLKLPSNTEVCITFLDDNAMRELNKTYRGINRTTDVLSFPQNEPNSTKFSAAIAKNNIKNLTLGDVIISVDTAKRHAKLYGNTIQKEIQGLIIHGILHLLGYNHKRKNDAIVMRKKEKELLSLISQ